MIEVFVFLFWAFVFCAGFYAIFLLVRAIDNQKAQKVGKPTLDRYVSPLHPSKDLRQQKPTVVPVARQPVTSKAQTQLLNLVNGDMQAANRLLEHTRKANPRQSEQWIWEKVIYDLERDRRI